MKDEDDDTYKKLLLSIRMIYYHGLIPECQYNKAFQKLAKIIAKENNLSLEETQKYIDSIWWNCGG